MSDKYKQLLEDTFVSTAELDVRDYYGHLRPDLDAEDNKTLLDIKTNSVERPDHYNQGKFEAIDVIEDWGLDFHCGNAIKYIARHKHKDQPFEDIEKAIWYLERYLEVLQKKGF